MVTHLHPKSNSLVTVPHVLSSTGWHWTRESRWLVLSHWGATWFDRLQPYPKGHKKLCVPYFTDTWRCRRKSLTVASCKMERMVSNGLDSCPRGSLSPCMPGQSSKFAMMWVRLWWSLLYSTLQAHQSTAVSLICFFLLSVWLGLFPSWSMFPCYSPAR